MPGLLSTRVDGGRGVGGRYTPGMTAWISSRRVESVGVSVGVKVMVAVGVAVEVGVLDAVGVWVGVAVPVGVWVAVTDGRT